MSPGIELGTSRTEGRALTNFATLAPVRKVAVCIWPSGTDKNAMLGGKKATWSSPGTFLALHLVVFVPLI